jgi:hypothetical protein
MKTETSTSWILACVLSVSCASSGVAKLGESQQAHPAVKSEAPPAPLGSACGQSLATFGETSIALASPAGFAEICTKDQRLCGELTAGYPPGVTTIGYFVPAEKWAARLRGEHPTLTRYLVAQATSTREAAFPALKNFLRERAGRIPDNSRVIKSLEDVERVDLGVLDEGPDFISPGVIISARLPGADRSLGRQVAINTAFITQGHVLSLYTHCAFTGQRDLDECRHLTTEWLTCLRGDAQQGVAGDGAPPRR